MPLLKLPGLVSFLVLSVMLTFLAFIILRIVFFVVFRDPHNTVSKSILAKSFYIGLKFDLRLALLVHLPILLLGWLGPLQLSGGGCGSGRYGGPGVDGSCRADRALHVVYR